MKKLKVLSKKQQEIIAEVAMQAYSQEYIQLFKAAPIAERARTDAADNSAWRTSAYCAAIEELKTRFAKQVYWKTLVAILDAQVEIYHFPTAH